MSSSIPSTSMVFHQNNVEGSNMASRLINLPSLVLDMNQLVVENVDEEGPQFTSSRAISDPTSRCSKIKSSVLSRDVHKDTDRIKKS